MKFKNLLNEEFDKEISKDKEIIAVLVFGSYAREEHYRDIDICLVLNKKYSDLEMTNKRLKYGKILSSKFDISVFQQLPLYIRKRVLKDGKIILCKNEELLYEIAFQTIKEFEYYKKIYYTYLNAIEHEK